MSFKKLDWGRIERLNYSVRKANLKYPDAPIGKDMVFLLDSLALLNAQFESVYLQLLKKIEPKAAEKK